jgi:hypothetical protein
MKTELIKSLIDLALNEPQESHVKSQPSGQHIVVLDRGFVYVGDIALNDEWVHISNAQNIRTWGTKSGLGELRNGPLSETKLDPCGVVLAPRRALISLIPCKGF